jgi:pimeloyl-ACP methyl ester carboxylesterase
LLILGLVLSTLWVLGSAAVAYRLTRRPHAWHQEPAPSVDWGRIESRRINTIDGHEIGSWFVEGRPECGSVLILHGHKGNRGNSLGRARFFRSLGYSVMMVSLRAHGDSTGEYDDIGYSARNDVIAAVEELEKLRPGRRVIIEGNSMGAAAAVFAAAELGHHVSGYILECPYRDLKGAVWNRTENALPPLLSHTAYMGLRLAGLFFLPHLERISPVEAIQSIPDDVPVLILSGDADRMARPEEARAIYERVKGHGKLVMVPNAGHGHLWNDDPELFEREVREFCEGLESRVR